jgi:hypothetical protein
MTFINFQEDAYSEQYLDNIETFLSQMDSITQDMQYSLGEDVCAALSESLDAEF